jgi:hypothetical protein
MATNTCDGFVCGDAIRDESLAPEKIVEEELILLVKETFTEQHVREEICGIVCP